MTPSPPRHDASNIEWAYYYLNLGWTPLPVKRGTKFPAVKWTEYQTRQPTPREIEWWNWSGGIGIVTNGLICVDCDGGGEQLLKGKDFPPSWTVRTGSGGLHRYYKANGKPTRNAVAILKGDDGAQVDIRADGGFIIVPPSQHIKTGKPYTWILPPWLDTLPLEPAPSWILDAIADKDRRHEASEGQWHPTWVTELMQGVPEGQRNDAAARLTGYLAEKVLPEDVAFEFLKPFAERCTPPFLLSELREVIASIYRTHQRGDGAGAGETQHEPIGRFTFPLSNLLSVPDEPVPYLAERLVVAGANGFIGGEPKSLKSWVALHTALCLSLGVRVFGRYPVPQPMRVLFISEEDGERRIKGRIWKLLMGLGVNPPGDDFFRYSIKAGIMLDDPEWIERLRAEMAEYKPGIVIGDVFELMHSKDGDKRSEMKPVFRNLDRLREEFSCGFLLADHFKKATIGTSRRGGQRLSGTVGKHAWGENSLYLFPSQGANRVRVETELKDGPSEVFGLALEDTEDGGVVFTWQAEAADREGEMKAKALAAVEGLALDGSWVKTKAIAEAMGVSTNTAKKYLDLLVDEDRKLDRDQRKEGKAEPFFWRLRAF